MRRKLAAVGAIALASFLMITNPVVADAARMITGSDIADNTVTSKDIKDKSLKSVDFKPGQLPAGPVGPAGATGATGAAGAPGPSGTVAVARFAGGIGSLAASSSVFAFAGPQATVATTATQVVVASGSAALGSTAATVVTVAMCYQPAAGGTVSVLGGPGVYAGSLTIAASSRISAAISSAQSLPSGSYKVGMCVRNPATLDSNDYAIGTVQVLQGAAALPRGTVAGARP